MEPLLKSLEPRSGFRVQASPSVVVRALCKSRKPLNPKPEDKDKQALRAKWISNLRITDQPMS